jgi:hypothetical protein
MALKSVKEAQKIAASLFPTKIKGTGKSVSIAGNVVAPVTAKKRAEGLFPSNLTPVAPKPVEFELSTTKNIYESLTETVTATGGTRTLSFGGQTTSALAYNASAATIKTALEALNNVAVDDVLVTQSTVSPFRFTFGETYEGVNVPLITVNTSFHNGETSSIASVTEGSVTNEVQTETLTATGGTRTLTFDGQTTSAIAYDANAATIQTALLALSNLATGDVVVTGTGPFTYTFGGAYYGTNVPVMTVGTGSLTGGTSSIATTVGGVPAVNEVQVETSNATSGTKTYTFNGETTAELPYNATAAEIQEALEDLSGVVAGDITVTGVYKNAYVFSGDFANLNAGAITVNTGSLTGGTSTIVQDAQSMKEIIARDKTKKALASLGLLRGKGQVTNDMEKTLRVPKDIGDADRVAGQDY